MRDIRQDDKLLVKKLNVCTGPLLMMTCMCRRPMNRAFWCRNHVRCQLPIELNRDTGILVPVCCSLSAVYQAKLLHQGPASPLAAPRRLPPRTTTLHIRKMLVFSPLLATAMTASSSGCQTFCHSLSTDQHGRTTEEFWRVTCNLYFRDCSACPECPQPSPRPVPCNAEGPTPSPGVDIGDVEALLYPANPPCIPPPSPAEPPLPPWPDPSSPPPPPSGIRWDQIR